MPRPSPATTVWEVYNGLVKDLRDQGLSLQAIGDQVGVTRERIRQILNEHYGTTTIPRLILRQLLARIIRCDIQRLKVLERKGVLKPLHTGERWLYSRDEAWKAVLALQRNCLHCGELLPISHGGKYCPKCQEDYHRNAYPFVSEESRKRRIEASRSWQKRHPEKIRETQRRASTKYQAKRRKEHYATTQYIVVCGNTMPIGSVVKAIGCEKSHLILENGLRILTWHVRVIKGEIY